MRDVIHIFCKYSCKVRCHASTSHGSCHYAVIMAACTVNVLSAWYRMSVSHVVTNVNEIHICLVPCHLNKLLVLTFVVITVNAQLAEASILLSYEYGVQLCVNVQLPYRLKFFKLASYSVCLCQLWFLWLLVEWDHRFNADVKNLQNMLSR